MNEKNMEGFNGEAVTYVTKSNGGLFAKVALAVVGIAAGVAGALFYKKKKGSKVVDAEATESEPVEIETNEETTGE